MSSRSKDEIDVLEKLLVGYPTPPPPPQATKARDEADRPAAKSFPDLFSLGHALEFAKDAGHMSDAARLEALQERSLAFGPGGYGTHLPLLAAVMQRSACDDSFSNPVLECGAGFYSTILLNVMCRADRRRLYTLDSDPAWLQKLAFLQSDSHVFRHVPGWTGDPWGKAIDSFGVDGWSVVFIDHREKLDRVHALRDKADYIVVHDTRNTFHAGLDDLLDTFEFRYDYVDLAPCTTVVSMTKPLAKEFPL
jgi:hypothetical protein